jgi:glycosyltransferase involved in cell wall biosynthesis
MRGAPPAVVVDCAGSVEGGGLRFRGELERYLAAGTADGVRLVGHGRRLDVGWLARRELTGPRQRAVAVNNISFVAGHGERWVLLRSMLHFLRPYEAAGVPGGMPRRIAATATLVRAAARRADVVVVPTSDMADRVARVLPAIAGRLTVRPHPLSVPAPVPAAERRPGRLLCPVLFAPYKAMGSLLRLADAAAERVAAESGLPVEIVVTASEQDAAAEGLTGSRRLSLVGRLTPEALAAEQRRCRALLYPTRLESFGYPLAEARLAGLPVVALDNPRNREVAGPALVSYQGEEDADALAAAMYAALTTQPVPEPVNPFDPTSYFDWLLDRVSGLPAHRPPRPARQRDGHSRLGPGHRPQPDLTHGGRSHANFAHQPQARILR